LDFTEHWASGSPGLRELKGGCSRRAAAFVSVNFAALASPRISSEIFGDEKGAFTGAMQSH
jgi:DNA-binding NtrC family response regulator